MFGVSEFPMNALYNKLRPSDSPVPFNAESMEDKLVKPNPAMPSAPYAVAGLDEELTSRRACEGILTLYICEMSDSL